MNDDTAKETPHGRRRSVPRIVRAARDDRSKTYASARALAAGLHEPDSNSSGGEPDSRMVPHDEPSATGARSIMLNECWYGSGSESDTETLVRLAAKAGSARSARSDSTGSPHAAAANGPHGLLRLPGPVGRHKPRGAAGSGSSFSCRYATRTLARWAASGLAVQAPMPRLSPGERGKPASRAGHAPGTS